MALGVRRSAGLSDYSELEMGSGLLRFFEFFRLGKDFDAFFIPMNGYVRGENDFHALYGFNLVGRAAGPEAAFHGNMVNGAFDGVKSKESRSSLVFFRVVGFISGKLFVSDLLERAVHFLGMGEDEPGAASLRFVQDDVQIFRFTEYFLFLSCFDSDGSAVQGLGRLRPFLSQVGAYSCKSYRNGQQSREGMSLRHMVRENCCSVYTRRAFTAE